MKANVLVECENEMKDSYYNWLKQYGAYDFVDEIVELNIEKGLKIGTNKASLVVNKINENNISMIISFLSKFKQDLN